MTVRVLVLGGTGEGRRLAELLHGRPGIHVISSLAGRVGSPVLPPGEVRVGGFGGAAGLERWLREAAIGAVVDATHPFASAITASAAAATRSAGVPLLVLRRPGWEPGPGDDWRWVGSMAEAAVLVPSLGRRIFLSTGRTEVAVFAGLDDLWFLLRSVDPPEPPLPRHLKVVLDRGPFRVEGEERLLRDHAVDVVVSRDGGSSMASAKLVAARRLGLPVVMVRRPPLPGSGAALVEAVETVEAVLDWLEALSGGDRQPATSTTSRDSDVVPREEALPPEAPRAGAPGFGASGTPSPEEQGRHRGQAG
jgi:precorrin-6A/cobalt-precorrin-6A reductase